MTAPTSTTEAILLPDAPSIPGLSFRHFRGESDYPHIAAMLNSSVAADRLDRYVEVEEVANTYAHLTNCDPYQDMLFVEVDGQPVGYHRIWWMQEENGPRIYGFQTFAAETEAWRERLLLAEGYAPARFGFTMVRPLDEPIDVAPMPNGLEVRRVRPELYRAVWEADAEAFRDHWGYVPPTEESYQEWRNSPFFDPKLWRVGFDAATGQVAGAVQNFVNERENEQFKRWRGWTEGIFVRRAWRRRGLARALLTRSLQMFKDLGFTEAALGVDALNPNGALRLYESVGFRPVRRETTYRKRM
jgi:ribosomal protein S18 acetylase RimI-like enzyme